MLGRTDSRAPPALPAGRLRRRLVRARRPARATGRSSSATPRRQGGRPDDRPRERAEPARRRSTTGAGPSCWPRASSATGSSPRRQAHAEQRRPTGRRAGPHPRPRRSRGDRRCATSSRAARPTSILAREIEPEVADRIRAERAGRIFGHHARARAEAGLPAGRRRPDSTLAAHLLGFVNRDGHRPVRRRTGLPGRPRRRAADRPGPRATRTAAAARRRADVEDRGVPGRGHPAHDRRRPPARASSRSSWPPRSPTSAKSVSAVVMDPYTGEVYAEATYPSYDANDYRGVAAKDAGPVHRSGRLQRLRAGLGLQDDDRHRRPRARHGHDHDQDQGHRARSASTAAGRKIDDADRRAMGWMTFEDGVAYSRNVVAAKVALKLGKKTRQSSAILHDTWLRLGFGAKTGIDVAGEVAGIVRDPAITPWRQIDLANGVVRPGRRGHADPARDRLRRADERRHAASSRTSSRRSAARRSMPSPRAAGHRRRRSRRRWSG